MAAESLNPEYTIDVLKERLGAAGKTFPTDLGIEPLEFGDEVCRGRIVVDERHLHPGKLVHGGVWVGLGDTVAAWQTFRHLPTGYDFTTFVREIAPPITAMMASHPEEVQNATWAAITEAIRESAGGGGSVRQTNLALLAAGRA